MDGRVDPSVYDNDAFGVAIDNDDIISVKLLHQDQRVVPTDNRAFALACVMSSSQLISQLLFDSRVDPSVHDNQALDNFIEWYSENLLNHDPIRLLKILLQDSRVDPSFGQSTEVSFPFSECKYHFK